MKIADFIQKIDLVAAGFEELLTAIAMELPEIKTQLEDAINGNLNTEEAKAAIAKLEKIETSLPDAIMQVRGFAPTVKTPEEGTDPSEEEPEPAEMPEEMPETEIPVEETPGDVGINGLPNMDFINVA